MIADAKPDRGADGPAALARDSRIVAIGGESKGSAVKGDRIEVRRYACECHLDRLNARGQIVDVEWRAGMRYRRTYLGATGVPRTTATYKPRGDTGGIEEVSAYRSDCREALRQADEALTPGQLAAVIAVCGHDQTIAGRMTTLQLGLRALVVYWEIEAEFCRSADS